MLANPLPDLRFLYNFARYTLAINRPWELSREDMEKYQVKALQKMINFASNTLLYQDKFREASIRPTEIKKMEDIQKLPFVTKQDLRAYGTKGTLPPGINSKLYKIDTSGSTGEPVSIYKDINMLALELTIMSRMLKAYNLSIFKTRITNIGDFTLQDSYDEECLRKGVYKKMGFLSPDQLKTVQSLYTGQDVKVLMREMERFNPELIIGYPGALIGLMILRKEGVGEGVRPKYIVSSGGVLDSYSRRQIEESFDTQVFDLYAATESGGVAFECLSGNYHVQSDYVHIEAIDEDGNQVAPDIPGHVVVSRLYGKGTPIIRYTGMNDYITFCEERCDCGMHTPLIEKVEGRSADSIVLPDGRIFPPATFTLIPGEVTQEFDVDKIQRFQIIQQKKNEIDILIVINNTLRHVGPSVDTLMKEIKKRYQDMVGNQVTVTVKEVTKVKKDDRRPCSPSSIVLSYVDHKNYI